MNPSSQRPIPREPGERVDTTLPAVPDFEAPYDAQCWPAIEDHMSKYDSTMVKDYSDDVYTLLTFVRHWILSKKSDNVFKLSID